METTLEANEIEASLDGTITFLRGGVRRPGIEPALEILETWEQRLAASGSPELTPIADNLAELRAVLLAGDPDPTSVGRMLAALGEQVRTAAESDVGGTVSERLTELSALLTEQGDQLAGR